MDGNTPQLAETGVAVTLMARMAGDSLRMAMAEGNLADMDYHEASELATAASLNPYAAFGSFGVDMSKQTLSREGTRQFFMRRYVEESERADYAAAVDAAKAHVADMEARTLERYARAMGVDWNEAHAAAVLGDVSFIRKAEENLAYA